MLVKPEKWFNLKASEYLQAPYAYYVFYAWWIYFLQLGALTEGTSLPVSHKHDQA